MFLFLFYLLIFLLIITVMHQCINNLVTIQHLKSNNYDGVELIIIINYTIMDNNFWQY